MKSRVASIVTLILLIALGFMLVYSCLFFASVQNSDYKNSLRVICQRVGDSLEGESADTRQEAVAAYASERTYDSGYFANDGTVICASDAQAPALTVDDMVSAKAETAVAYTLKNTDGNNAICAIYQFEDGDFLLFSRDAASGWKLLKENKLLLCFAVLYAALAGVAIWSIASMDREKKLTARTMAALDAFSEGKFDARIEPMKGREQAVGEYNAIIGRIQDRVFRQASRNHALSIVMNQMQNGIIAVDHELNVILVTPVAKKLLGIIGSPEGKSVCDASKDVKLDDVFNEAMRQGGVYTNEVAARTAVGRGHRPLRLYVSPMRNDGTVVGALAMVEDITEIRRLEQVRTDFAANVSHELKTPLTSIRGFVETLEAGAIDNPEAAHKFLKIIMLETERLTRLINDILSISKLESGNDEVPTQRIRLDKMAYDVADMLTIHAGEKEVTINCHMNKTPVNIIGNSDRVEQMLINLVENAIKYNRPGGSVTVQVFSNGLEANVAISDTGIGIAEENLTRLFERFYRVDKGRSRQMGGTGLGLAIVKHIVRSMNGEIEVHSKLDEGTEFLITLPLAPEGEAEQDDDFFDDEVK